MRIGLNLLYLIPKIQAGTGTYAHGLLNGLAEIDNENEYIIFVNKDASKWPIPNVQNFERIVCSVSGLNRGMRYYYEQIRLPNLLKRYRITLIHSLGYVGPLMSPCPSVVTIHDLNFVDLKYSMSVIRQNFLKFFSTQSAKQSTHIITISEFSKEKICKVLRLPSNRITVTHLAAQEKSNVSLQNNWKEIAKIYGIRVPYIASFGRDAVHKNIPRLIHSFANIKKVFPHQLVLIGRQSSKRILMKLIESLGIEKSVIFTGYIPETHVHIILNHADLFVLPSLYEGFGIPVLEAQHAGSPIACSKSGSLPEIAGKGAIFFDPKSIHSITQTIARCLNDVKLREDLLHLGKINLERFSWQKTATKTLSIYKKISLNSGRTEAALE